MKKLHIERKGISSWGVLRHKKASSIHNIKGNCGKKRSLAVKYFIMLMFAAARKAGRVKPYQAENIFVVPMVLAPMAKNDYPWRSVTGCTL